MSILILHVNCAVSRHSTAWRYKWRPSFFYQSISFTQAPSLVTLVVSFKVAFSWRFLPFKICPFLQNTCLAAFLTTSTITMQPRQSFKVTCTEYQTSARNKNLNKETKLPIEEAYHFTLKVFRRPAWKHFLNVLMYCTHCTAGMYKILYVLPGQPSYPCINSWQHPPCTWQSLGLFGT